MKHLFLYYYYHFGDETRFHTLLLTNRTEGEKIIDVCDCARLKRDKIVVGRRWRKNKTLMAARM